MNGSYLGKPMTAEIVKEFAAIWGNNDEDHRDIKRDLDGARILIDVDTGGWDACAIVVYEKGDLLFEVNGSHCSCYGYEGQWEPEETSWEALAVRSWGSFYEEASDIEKIVRAHIPAQMA